VTENALLTVNCLIKLLLCSQFKSAKKEGNGTIKRVKWTNMRYKSGFYTILSVLFFMFFLEKNIIIQIGKVKDVILFKKYTIPY